MTNLDQQRDLLLNAILANDYNSVVDIGTGGGWALNEVYKKYPKMKLVGVDIANPCIDYAKKNRINKKIKFEVADIRFKTKYKNNEFDLAYTHGCFIHVPPDQIEKALTEVMRFSKAGLFIESSSTKAKKKGKFKYDAKKYWNSRSARNEFTEEDRETVYYFSHDYERLFKRLKMISLKIGLDKKTKTFAYFVWRKN